MKLMEIFTDGGCTGNPGPGGWAAVLLPPGENEITLSGGSGATTNNRMELTGVIEALTRLLEMGREGQNVVVHTDSRYVQQGITVWIKNWEAKGWRTAAGKPVKNVDLWKRLRDLDGRFRVDWRWVKGHSGNRWNELCDQLVAAERERFG